MNNNSHTKKYSDHFWHIKEQSALEDARIKKKTNKNNPSNLFKQNEFFVFLPDETDKDI